MRCVPKHDQLWHRSSVRYDDPCLRAVHTEHGLRANHALLFAGEYLRRLPSKRQLPHGRSVQHNDLSLRHRLLG